jgi:CubicO group peptidase (beta-lactamase class C family)
LVLAVEAQAPPAERVRPQLRELGVPGMTWSLVRDDTVVLGAAGVRDAATGVAITPATRVQAGSVAKLVLATGVLQLVTRGALRLDAPIADYLPDLPIDNPWDATSPIRVRHLLDHTSGLGDAHLWQVFSRRTSPDLPLREALTRRGTRLAAQAEPGARVSYSNTACDAARSPHR